MIVVLSSPLFNGKKMGTVDMLSRFSVLRSATRCCICHVVIWSPNSSPSPGLQPPLFSSQAASTANKQYQSWEVGFQHPTEMRHWCFWFSVVQSRAPAEESSITSVSSSACVLAFVLQDILHVVCLASFAFSFESKASTFFIVSHTILSTFHNGAFARNLHQHLNILLLQKSGITWRPAFFNFMIRIFLSFWIHKRS